MTVLAAYTSPDGCYMSFDSAASDGETIYRTTTDKAFIHSGNGIIGAAGSWRIINLLAKLKGRKCSPQMIVEMLKNVKGEEEAVKETEILCAWPNRPLVIIQGDLAVIEMEQPFMAVGSGAAYALGYLEACEEVGALELDCAVEVAIQYSTDVIGPVKSLYCGSK